MERLFDKLRVWRRIAIRCDRTFMSGLRITATVIFRPWALSLLGSRLR